MTHHLFRVIAAGTLAGWRTVLPMFFAGMGGGLLPGFAAPIHVSPSGDDAAPGTAERPVRTLERARDLVRAAADGGRVVELSPGTWRIAGPLVLGPGDSGVTWRAARPGQSVISGGEVLSGWEVTASGDWTLQTPPTAAACRELFVDGARAPRARHPNQDYWRVASPFADRRSGFNLREGERVAVPDLEGVELLFLHDWSVTRVGVKSLDAAAGTLATTHSIGCGAPHYAIDHFEPNPRYALENSAVFLDQPGEWTHHPSAGKWVYRPLPGQIPARVEVVRPVASALVRVEGREDAPVKGVRFEGLRFEHCAWAIPPSGYAEGQANFHEPRDGGPGFLRGFIPAAVDLRLARECALVDCRFERLGGAGLWIGSRTASCRVERCQFRDISGNGLMLGEPTAREVGGRPWWQSAPGQVAEGHRVEGCLVEGCGRQYFGAVGIWVGLMRGVEIVRNEVRHLPYTGISLGWIWEQTPSPAGENRVEENHIHHIMRELSDGGGIYTLGRQPGSVLRANRIHDVPVNAGRAESNGMFLDEGTSGFVIEDNDISAVARSPLRFHRAGVNDVRRNRLACGPGIPPVRYNNTPEANVRLEGNRVEASAP